MVKGLRPHRSEPQIARHRARGLLDGTLEDKRAMKLAYFLQLAATNVGRVTFEPEREE